MSDTTKELLELMNGYEVMSLNYEGVVYVKGKEVWRDGEMIDTLGTDTKVKELWLEYIASHGLA